MALINCPECKKEISDKASSCPNCGCPISSIAPKQEAYSQTIPPSNATMYNNNPVQKKKKHPGCLISVILFFLFISCLVWGINTILENPEKYSKSSSVSIDELEDEQMTAVNDVLTECGIENIKSIEHDELLDNAYFDGDTGYRLSTNIADNIILYLNADKIVYQIHYAGNALYSDGTVQAKLTDYIFTNKEVSSLQYNCEDMVKQVLKSPSSAKFPNFTEWGFSKDPSQIIVQGYVDSENSFGANIRSDFQFIIDRSSNTVTSFIFDGSEMIQ